MKKYDPFADDTSVKGKTSSQITDNLHSVDRFENNSPKEKLWNSDSDKAIGLESHSGSQSNKRGSLPFKSTSPILILALGIVTLMAILLTWTSFNSGPEIQSRSRPESSSDHKGNSQGEPTPEKSVALIDNARCYEKRYEEVRSSAIEKLRTQGKSEREVQQTPEGELVPGGLRQWLNEECRTKKEDSSNQQGLRTFGGLESQASSSGVEARDTSNKTYNSKPDHNPRSGADQRSDVVKSTEVNTHERDRRILEERLKAQEVARLASERRQRDLEIALEREKRAATEESLKRAQLEVQQREEALTRTREAKEKLEAENLVREQVLAKERQRSSELERELKDQSRAGAIEAQRERRVERGEVVCPSTPSPVIPTGMKLQSGKIRATAYIRQGIGVVDVKINESNMPHEFDELVIRTMKRYSCYVRNGNEGETWREFLFKP